MVGLLFPGQGSQRVGMGRDLAAAHRAARATFEEADEALGFALSRLCFDGPEDQLTLTHNAQPAIMTHSLAVHRCIADRLEGVSAAAGHSLGEFSAWVAAGAIGFADGVRTVRRRGELMLGSGEARPGTMAAVIGLDDQDVERVCAEASDDAGVCVAANFNSPGQTVISGDVVAVQRAMEMARAAGARRIVALNVSGAFHSPLMSVAESGLAEQLASLTMKAPAFPVVSNVTARPVSDAGEARELLRRQLTSPVRWAEGVVAMREMGIDQFIEVGPGNVLTGLLRRIDREAKGRSLDTVAEVDAFIDVQPAVDA